MNRDVSERSLLREPGVAATCVFLALSLPSLNGCRGTSSSHERGLLPAAHRSGQDSDEPSVEPPLELSPIQKACRGVMSAIEARTGFSFPSSEVEVRFAIPERYRGRDYFFVGHYEAEANAIVLHPRYEKRDLSPLLEVVEHAALHPDSFPLKDEVDEEFAHLAEVLAHELGHFFVDALIKTRFPNSWIAEVRAKEKLSVNDLGYYIIQEGIGEYFGAVLAGRKDYFSPSVWERTHDIEELQTSEMRTFLAYDGGYSLLRPLLSKHGERALEYFVQHELKIDVPSLAAAPAYAQEAAQVLSR
ncbi:hypothetical protein MRY87_11610 [bacterium]|nr:hypothetical protein [bacterium]